MQIYLDDNATSSTYRERDLPASEAQVSEIDNEAIQLSSNHLQFLVPAVEMRLEDSSLLPLVCRDVRDVHL